LKEENPLKPYGCNSPILAQEWFGVTLLNGKGIFKKRVKFPKIYPLLIVGLWLPRDGNGGL